MLVRDSQGRRGVFLGTILSQRDFQDLNALAGGDRGGRAELAGRAISEWLDWRRRAGAIPPTPPRSRT